jgi:hypothetical protein
MTATKGLRLFQLKDTTTGQRVGNYFPDKMSAKRARDDKNKGTAQFVVTLGPDHRRVCGKMGGVVGTAN